jgi:hypothetical protein
MRTNVTRSNTFTMRLAPSGKQLDNTTCVTAAAMCQRGEEVVEALIHGGIKVCRKGGLSVLKQSGEELRMMNTY